MRGKKTTAVIYDFFSHLFFHRTPFSFVFSVSADRTTLSDSLSCFAEENAHIHAHATPTTFQCFDMAPGPVLPSCSSRHWALEI